MTAGRLASKYLSATTNTVVYSADIDSTASVMVTAANWSGGAATYRLGLRDYDQILRINGPQVNSNGGIASTHKFAKGNPVSAYKLTLSPGFAYSSAVPGTNITSTNGATAKMLDVYKPTDTINYYVKFEEISDIPFAAETVVGQPVGGETITGGTSALTATHRGYITDTNLSHINIADVASGATAIKVSRNTGLADSMILTVGPSSVITGTSTTELITIDGSGINTANNTLTVTRGAYGTTPRAIKSGEFVTAFTLSATASTINEGSTYATGDAILTLTDATGFLTGQFIVIDNEVIEVTDVNGNDLTVTRGMYGTSDVDHNNGAAVTALTDGGNYLLNYFTEGENVTFGTSNATATLNFTVSGNVTITPSYILSTTSAGATDHQIVEPITINNERSYRFDQSDSSNTAHPLKFSGDNAEGANSDTGTEYTTGVSKVGTAGQAGSYSEITVDDNIPTTILTYSDAGVDGDGTANDAGAGFTFEPILDPLYTDIYVYKIAGEPFTAADTFTIGTTTQTIQASGVTAGPYGYVHAWDADTALLKVSLDIGSTAFANGTEFYTTPTLNNANRDLIEAVDGKILTITGQSGADGSRTTGTYNLVASSSNGSGTTQQFNVVVDGSGAATVTIVDGGKGHANGNTITIADSVLGAGGAANLTFNVDTVSTAVHVGVTGTENHDWLHYDLSVADNTQQRDTAIVVGPGQNLVAYGSAQVNVLVQGFETASSDYTIVHLPKEEGEGGGAAAGGG
jgi:hypothetical protein